MVEFCCFKNSKAIVDQFTQRAAIISGINFFSVWINEGTLRENRLYYNIHALKLRELSAYTIKSRDFADAFRLRFDAFKEAWPNVIIDFGPLTLMEGWIIIEADRFENVITDLAYKFLAITFIIDELLEERKVKRPGHFSKNIAFLFKQKHK